MRFDRRSSDAVLDDLFGLFGSQYIPGLHLCITERCNHYEYRRVALCFWSTRRSATRWSAGSRFCGPPSCKNGCAPGEPTSGHGKGLCRRPRQTSGSSVPAPPTPRKAHVRIQLGNPHARFMEAHFGRAGQPPTPYQLANTGRTSSTACQACRRAAARAPHFGDSDRGRNNMEVFLSELARKGYSPRLNDGATRPSDEPCDRMLWPRAETQGQPLEPSAGMALAERS